MGNLPRFWYRTTAIWWPRLLKNLTIFLDNRFAVSLNLLMFLTPMFQDRSWLGRILSLTVRSARIISGTIIIGITLAAATTWFLIWILATPLLIVIWPIERIWRLFSRDQNLSPTVKNLIKSSHSQVDSFKQQLANTKMAGEFLNRLEISPTAFLNLNFPLALSDWLNRARQESTESINPVHLVLAILKLNQWRYRLGVTTYHWQQQMIAWARTPFLWDKDYQIRPIGGVDRAQTGIPTPTLDRYSYDLTRQAQKRQLPEIIGKEKEIGQLVKILSKKGKSHCLIIGEPGSGKTTLLKGLAQEIVRGVGATSLRFKRVVSLDSGRLASGADDAEITQRIERIIDEISVAANIILFVDEIHQLAVVNRDTPETSNLFRALEPVLDNGQFQFIGATTTENYKKYIEPNEAFSRLFEIIELPEATETITENLLEYLAWQREKNKLMITRRAISRIVELANRYIHDRVLPDKAVNLLDEAVAEAETTNSNLITSADIDRLVTEKTKVPITQVTRNEAKILLTLEAKLHQRVIGQETAIKAVSAAIRRARTQLKNPHKPIAGFLFAGPTGVGKTETAKALTAEFFGNANMMIRLDMSEYQTIASVDRLLTILTEAVRHQPYALLLLDEIEKAHEKITNLFLQVLDDARLTDTNGKTADFANTIIIATTNAKNLKKTFAPEWLNRFNAVITFNRLTTAQIESVVKLKLNQLRQNLLKQEIQLEFAPQTVAQIAREAFSDEWGGRQADRVIQNLVENVLAEKLLRGEISKNQPYLFSL